MDIVQKQIETARNGRYLWCDPDIFLRYREAELAPIPISVNGYRVPLVAWKPFQTVMPTVEEIHGWFAWIDRTYRTQPGVAIVTGSVSRNLEVLDFDDNGAFTQWLARCPRDLIRRLPIVYTPSNGWHVYYRSEMVGRNQKLAMTSDNSEVRIETRGQGGIVLTVGSPARCHPANLLYDWAGGPSITETPTINAEERSMLITTARSLNQAATPAVPKSPVRETTPVHLPFDTSIIGSSLLSPWTRMDRYGNWRDILEPHGWRSTDGVKWTRPGKLEGTSAVVGLAKNGCEILTVFSTNAGRLSPSDGHVTYGKFGAYAALVHNGNRTAAARFLSKNGFNSQKGTTANG